MRGSSAALTIVLVIVLCARLARAQEPLSLVGRHELECPVCQQVFTTLSCSQTNTRGGVDRDLFARALGPEPEYYRISTCPRCGYSGYLSDFNSDVIITPDLRDRIMRVPKLMLPLGFTAKSDPRELDAMDRYRLAIQCYRWLQRSDEAMGWLNLRASWIARDEGSILPKDDRLARVMKYIERWRPFLPAGGNQLDVEMKLATRVVEALASGQFDRFQRPYVELAVALILRRHGENRQVEPMLDRLARYEGFDASLRKGVERMRDSIKLEREFQTEAAGCFERALLAGRIDAKNRGTAKYLLAELLRRIGRDREAERWYGEALSDKLLPQQARDWARLGASRATNPFLP